VQEQTAAVPAGDLFVCTDILDLKDSGVSSFQPLATPCQEAHTEQIHGYRIGSFKLTCT
jgi:hypothetical protein